MRRRARLGPLLAGLGTGAAMSVVADELMTPALGFSAPNRDYPLATHIRVVVAHLAFGLGVAGPSKQRGRCFAADRNRTTDGERADD